MATSMSWSRYIKAGEAVRVFDDIASPLVMASVLAWKIIDRHENNDKLRFITQVVLEVVDWLHIWSFHQNINPWMKFCCMSDHYGFVCSAVVVCQCFYQYFRVLFYSSTAIHYKQIHNHNNNLTIYQSTFIKLSIFHHLMSVIDPSSPFNLLYRDH